MHIKARPKKPSNWSELLLAERNIVRIFVGLLLLYFFGQVFISFVYSFFGGQGFSQEAVQVFLADVDVIWSKHIGGFFIVLNIVLFFAMLYFFKLSWKYRSQLKLYPPPTEDRPRPTTVKRDPKIMKHWREIVLRANTGAQENLRSAIIEADALVDHHLKALGFEGEHMGDRLKQLRSGQVKSLDKLWNAHRLRNDIAHTPGYQVSPRQAEKALLAYRDFLKEMKAF